MAYEGVFGEAVDRIGGEPISARMARRAPVRHLDPSLLLVTLLLSAYGAIMVQSTTSSSQSALLADPNTFVRRQLAYLVAGVVVLLAVAIFDYRHFGGFAAILYGSTVLALILVLLIGDSTKGATRWINLGAFQAQPSEFAKLAVIVAVAAYLAQRKGDVRGTDVAFCVGVVAVPAVLIYLQPDLGTMMVFVGLLGALLLVGGARVRHFVVLGVMGLVATVFVLQSGLLKDYQVQRLTSFLDPNPDVQSVGYNLTQSKIAIGSGGMRGKGLGGQNTQTALDFVPEQHTDFIFTAVGEQLGFVGSATLLGLFAFLLWRAIRIATMSRDLFGTLLASGIVALWSFQLFVNVGMTMGIMPITGIPLPFMSYGGSSLITNYVAVGLLLNIHMRRFL
ncbi:MAG TPA: rod shape-determining protein RodA [Actinomycetota bacterium]|nr:rod shape-determining protein RodA [Actinomycetota bacterium]